jgi:hypothetical protein
VRGSGGVGGVSQPASGCSWSMSYWCPSEWGPWGGGGCGGWCQAAAISTYDPLGSDPLAVLVQDLHMSLTQFCPRVCCLVHNRCPGWSVDYTLSNFDTLYCSCHLSMALWGSTFLTLLYFAEFLFRFVCHLCFCVLLNLFSLVSVLFGVQQVLWVVGWTTPCLTSTPCTATATSTWHCGGTETWCGS